MRFTRLRLNGFKSFVDSTDLVISKGLTGIVGPNGCGKSNLLEAMRWVMGENRPSAMRGAGMEDVIFAGAATRGARAHAEVALTIDNAQRLAPAGFNDSDTIEVMRRITRDAGSAYRINGKDARARDVQMLFADASTGAHSPALVRQGQISELINAKPTARRRILEEAAGISGLYQRRHEAELKLKGAEQNLARVDDVIEQLSSQLATLSRQARSAQRYREIGAKLRQAEGMLFWQRWKEAEDARAAAEAELKDRLATAARAEATALAAADTRAAFERSMAPLREEEAIATAVLQRLESTRETLRLEEVRAQEAIANLRATLRSLEADAEREEALNADAHDTIARLEDERDTLMDAQADQTEAIFAAEAAAEEAREILADRESELSALTEDTARIAARHHSAQRFAEESRRALEKAIADAARAAQNLAAAEVALVAADEAFVAAEEAEQRAVEGVETADAAFSTAESQRAAAQTREDAARALRAEAEGEAAALRAEIAALARLVERDSAEDGALLDLLQVAPGYEKALGAALADDLRAPIVEASARTGWVRLPLYAKPQPLPAEATPLAEAVQVPEVLARVITQVGLVEAADGARLQAALLPGQRLVSREGDIWRWDGFRAGAGDAPSAAALRLEQRNRLETMRAELAEAEVRAEEAIARHEEIQSELQRLTRADQSAREARREADRTLAEVNRALARAEADRNISASKRDALAAAVRRLDAETHAARAATAEADTQLKTLPDLFETRAKLDTVKTAVEAARIAMISRRTQAEDIKRTAESRTRRAQDILQEITSWEARLRSASLRAEELLTRRKEAEQTLEEALVKPEDLAFRREELGISIAEADVRRAAAHEALASAETKLREATLFEREIERGASEAREGRARAEARMEGTNEAVAHTAGRIAEVMETTPEALFETLETAPEDMPPMPELETSVATLKRQREQLGAVNLRAEEDARALSDEHGGLLNEKTDLESAIRTLRGGIGNLNREGRERLLAAFDTVNENFRMLFTHLFGGGEARLVMVESDDPLEAGLEIMCQPPGKRLATLSLLSGGEQTLTALALIFAVFLANPAPICVLDEVDAPLDDHNVTRFCDLMDEMTKRTETRFLVITHHAVTMARMDRLFGVTMAEQGVSQLVSVDLGSIDLESLAAQ